MRYRAKSSNLYGTMPEAEIYRIYLLRQGARPRRYEPLTFQQVQSHRHIDCPCYADCLQFVAQSPWRGFSCDRCPCFTGRAN